MRPERSHWHDADLSALQLMIRAQRSTRLSMLNFTLSLERCGFEYTEAADTTDLQYMCGSRMAMPPTSDSF
jgi:hypothetical protein